MMFTEYKNHKTTGGKNMKKENTTNTKKATTTNTKENTTMKNTKSKKSVAKATETKKEVTAQVTETAKEVKTEEVKAVKENKSKESTILSAEVIMKMYEDAGIKCYNPTAKGNYRIMGSSKGSSLNWGKYGFRIFSTDEDFKAVSDAKIEGVTVSKGANSQDKVRPNTVEIKAIEVLATVLKVYAQNTANAVVKAS